MKPESNRIEYKRQLTDRFERGRRFGHWQAADE